MVGENANDPIHCNNDSYFRLGKLHVSMCIYIFLSLYIYICLYIDLCDSLKKFNAFNCFLLKSVVCVLIG